MRKRICFVTTISASIKSFLLPLARYMVENDNYDVTFVCDEDESMYPLMNEHIHYKPIKMKRGIAFDGVVVIYKLIKLFKREQFDIVQYATPNASLYGSIASRMAGVPVRIYCEWGVRYIDFTGLARFAYRQLMKIMCNNATHIEVESHSIYDFSVKDKLYKPEKAMVIWNGSACGVDLDRYILSNKTQWRKEVRSEYKIEDDARVFGYCGRITRDKGLNELFGAFKRVVETSNSKFKAYLMIIGGNDNVQSIDPVLFSWAKTCPQVIFTGFTNNVPRFYSALDVFTSLSYREGFGLVVIEAAAMGVPGIVTNVPGQCDTIEHMRTGYSVFAHDVDSVVQAMEYCIENPKEVQEMGIAARKNVEEKYEQKELFKRLTQHRNQMIEEMQLSRK